MPAATGRPVRSWTVKPPCDSINRRNWRGWDIADARGAELDAELIVPDGMDHVSRTADTISNV